MLEHMRSRTLDKFNEAFDNTLNSGGCFFVAARDCTDSLFDEECAGIVAKVFCHL